MTANRVLPNLDYYADHISRQVRFLEGRLAEEVHEDEVLGPPPPFRDPVHADPIIRGRRERMRGQE